MKEDYSNSAILCEITYLVFEKQTNVKFISAPNCCIYLELGSTASRIFWWEQGNAPRSPRIGSNLEHGLPASSPGTTPNHHHSIPPRADHGPIPLRSSSSASHRPRSPQNVDSRFDRHAAQRLAQQGVRFEVCYYFLNETIIDILNWQFESSIPI